jgi:hypothetical protein
MYSHEGPVLDLAWSSVSAKANTETRYLPKCNSELA